MDLAKWLGEIREFRSAFENAQRASQEWKYMRWEEEAARRAVEGWEEPVFWNGRQIGTRRRFSDSLLIFLFEAYRATSQTTDSARHK
jgi:hypothetical protein